MKRMLTLIAAAAGLLFLPGTGQACSFYPLGFCEVAKEANLNGEAAILEFTILEHVNHGARVRVDQVWGGLEYRQELMIWDRKDFDCNGIFRQDVTHYGPVGTRIVAVLGLIDSVENGWEQTGDYLGSFFSFTDGYLRLENGRWKSHYQNFDHSVDINENKLDEYLSDCLGYQVQPYLPGQFSVAPNPVTSNTLRLLRTSNQPADVRIYDLQGRVVAVATMSAEETDLLLPHLTNGYYLLEVRMGHVILRKKILIRRE